MRHIIDLTGSNFDRIDFTEAKIIDFFCQRTIPRSFEFDVWGATLLVAPRWKHAEPFDPLLQREKDMYVSGKGIIKLNNLVGGSIRVGIFDKVKDAHGCTIFAENRDGSRVRVQRKWGLPKTEGLSEYLWECAIAWPYGACVLTLYTDGGTVTYEFNDEDMITADAYVNDPHKYTYNEEN